MILAVIGINHETASVETREQLAFSSKQVKELVQKLIEGQPIKEASVLSTCNRTEVHFTVNTGQIEAGKNHIMTYLSDFSDLDPREYVDHLYFITDQEAVSHIFKVTAGLNSLVTGETEILGQVKKAYQLSDEAGGVDSIFHGLYQQALRTGKRVHRETGINDNAASVSYASVELATKIFGSLQNRRALIIGAGKMSELAARHLYSNGVKDVIVINRTIERAKNLADKFGGLYASYDQLSEWLNEIDIVITSTGAPHFVIKEEQIKRAMKSRKYSPMFLIDIAVPRDVEPSVNNQDNAYLYTIDDLEAVVESNMQERQEEARNAELIISEEVAEFMVWYKTRDVVPLISALREKAEDVRKMELEKYHKKLKNLSPKEQEAVDKLTKSIVNKILKEPVLRIKEFAVEDKSELYMATLAQLFDLEDEVIPKDGEEHSSSKEVESVTQSSTERGHHESDFHN
ncbi:glutamyl-tRNA reductase [Natranaerobius thermophilus]|uniref:Glutamyl-tRNA reductase n=1 Tax=Natranaerobius thermophilus (strain ATCC BAA-1301 / DSM 18059 / JW/NM-WN-LF) TaxID=457570 RepID=HEM1_NATTJ|nr:glutamyl-tRNA reductase [Natranaerobius thermophilus]B2A1G4.1 RecName: Full=Glutamyl-tRNA reductase; Short=GluTR [Natranaerobius thermophilus JW/NM-WN-LF]ACB84704.1 glutamyl-tRNA reductase [Natranaerobius thermophilus JW/NM-WN-LF]